MKRFLSISILLALVALTMVACGGGSNGGFGGSGNPSAVFVSGEDAPLPSVLSFNITINSIALNGTTSTPAQVLSAPTTVDFARFVGLRSLMGFNAVPAGTYSSATITLANDPVITYLNIGTNPPTVATMNGTLLATTVTVNFPTAMVVTTNGLAGLHMDFDLRQSLLTSGSPPQITGFVNPTIFISVVSASDEEGQITDFTGGLVSVNTAKNSFVVQGPFGFQETVDVNSQTAFNPGWSLNTMATPEFVSVEGTVQGDGSILANNVEVVSTTQAFISGRVLAVNPASGPVSTVTLYIGEELPALTGPYALGSVVTLDVSGVSQYDVCFFDNVFSNLLFNASSMVAGQRIFIGGSWDSSTQTFTPSMISLRRQGVVGDLTGSVTINNGNQGSFLLDNSLLLGYVLGGPLTVNTNNATVFIGVDGLTGLATTNTNLVARGLVFKDGSGNPELWAHRVRVLP